MNKIILLMLVSFNSFAQISTVNSGNLIEANKINEVIQKTNDLGTAKKIQHAFPLGTILNSILTLPQFQAVNGDCWRLMDGSSLSGTDLNTLTGMASLPNATSNGEFLRQAKSGRQLGSLEGDAIRNISGQFGVFPSLSGTVSGPFQKSTAGSAWGGGTASFSTTMTFNASLQVPTADENRPKNVAVNMFIKVNNQCD